jgi:hypothetical protein
MNRSVAKESNIRSDKEWAGLYRVGALAAFAYVAMVLVPLVLMIVAPLPPMEGGAKLLEYVVAHREIYLAELICFVGLGIPAIALFTALGVALRSASPSFALLGSVLGIASETIAVGSSSPPSLNFALVELARRYATAAGPDREALAAGAEALMASANAVSLVGVLTAIGILIVSCLFAKGGLGRVAGVIGIVTGAAGIVLETFRPYIGPVYGLYGLLLPAWSIAAGVALARKAREAAAASKAID